MGDDLLCNEVFDHNNGCFGLCAASTQPPSQLSDAKGMTPVTSFERCFRVHEWVGVGVGVGVIVTAANTCPSLKPAPA